MTKVYVRQDGKDFYLYRKDPNTAPMRESEPLHYALSAPMEVRDFDLEAATRARRWFLDYCDSNNYIPEFV